MRTYRPTFQASVLHYWGSNVFRPVTVILYLRYTFPVVRMWFMTTCWFQASQKLLFGLVFSPEDESCPLSKRWLSVFSDNGKCPGTYQWRFACSTIVKKTVWWQRTVFQTTYDNFHKISSLRRYTHWKSWINWTKYSWTKQIYSPLCFTRLLHRAD